MNMQQLIDNIIPKQHFTIQPEGTTEERTQHLLEQCYPGATGMKLGQIGADYAEAIIPFDQKIRALHGFMHGGCFFTVGDTLTALMCMYQLTTENERMLTANASIRYLRPILDETVVAKARLKKQDGNRFDFICDFLNSSGKLAARGKYTYVVTEPKI